jgi:2-keto-4-pentenoate hydratase/2-oxohepta-3-ene-1,7-dioic acid hydratase in catechol pathway
MRLAHIRDDDGRLHLAVQREAGWVDVAAATGDARVATLPGLLSAGAEAVLGRVSDGPVIDGPRGPVAGPGARIFCIGRNYVAHRDELANQPTPWPEVFLRVDSSVSGPEDDVVAPAVVEKLDYEGELAVVIGRPGRHIPAARALEHVLGFTIANDVSARDWQWRGGQWTSGKNFDGTLPLGPELVTHDDLPGWDDALLETRLNGEVMQSARTSQFIFDLPTQIEFLSSWATLQPGDVICTGTPGGVGAARTPPRFLAPGDVVEVAIEGIGALRNGIVADALTPATGHGRDVANSAG